MYPLREVSHADIENWNHAASQLSRINDLQVQKVMTEIFTGHKKGDIYRLPTEAEWEFVARMRGFSTGEYSHGNTVANLSEYAWFGGDHESQTHPVGLKKPTMINGMPIYDMSGNVSENLADRYADNLAGGVDPQGPEQRHSRVVRGSSIYSNLRDELKLSYRSGHRDPSRGYVDVGFRLVRTRP